LREVQRFLKVSRYREVKHHAELRKEISRLPTGRWSENVQTGLKVEKPKQISKTIAEYGERPSTMPRMAISAYGSMRPPKRTTLPSYGAQGRTRQSGKKFVKTIVPHDQYVEMLNEGYTRDQLESQGIVDKYSRYYQDESVFGKGVVAYKPISMYQAFVKPNPPKTIYQRRQETGLPYETFKPFSVGTSDEFGERKTNFKPKRIYL
jgi:hypothetical protein